MAEVKLCPFCGLKPDVETHTVYFRSVDADGNQETGEETVVSCCGIDYVPIDVWDYRPIESALLKELEELRDTVDKLGKALKDAVEDIKDGAHDQLDGTRLLSSALKDIDETYREALQLIDNKEEV